MRTTLAIDDDVLLVVRERARREGRTVGEVLSDLARRALTSSPGGDAAGDEFFGFEPFASRGGTITNSLVEQLRADEEV